MVTSHLLTPPQGRGTHYLSWQPITRSAFIGIAGGVSIGIILLESELAIDSCPP